MPLRNGNECVNGDYTDYFPKDFKVSLIRTGRVTPDSCCLHFFSSHYENKANNSENCIH